MYANSYGSGKTVLYGRHAKIILASVRMDLLKLINYAYYLEMETAATMVRTITGKTIPRSRVNMILFVSVDTGRPSQLLFSPVGCVMD